MGDTAEKRGLIADSRDDTPDHHVTTTMDRQEVPDEHKHSDGDVRLTIKVTDVQPVGVGKQEDYVAIEVSCSNSKWIVIKSGRDIKHFHNALVKLLPPGEVSLRTLEENYPLTESLFQCGGPFELTQRTLPAIEKYLQVFTSGRDWLGNLTSINLVRDFFGLSKPFYFVRNDDVAGFKFCFMTLAGNVEDEFITCVDKAKGNILHYAACKGSSGIVSLLGNFLSSKGRGADLVKLFEAEDIFGITPVQLSRQYKHIQAFIDIFKQYNIDWTPVDEEKKEEEECYPPLQYLKAAEDLSWRFIANPISGQARAVRVYNDVVAPVMALKGCRYVVSGMANIPCQIVNLT
jgi:hypothetical protein